MYSFYDNSMIIPLSEPIYYFLNMKLLKKSDSLISYMMVDQFTVGSAKGSYIDTVP